MSWREGERREGGHKRPSTVNSDNCAACLMAACLKRVRGSFVGLPHTQLKILFRWCYNNMRKQRT